MVNTRKIRGRIIEFGLTQGAVAAKMGLSQAVLSQKIGNRRRMTLSEAGELQKILKIPAENFGDFFFNK